MSIGQGWVHLRAPSAAATPLAASPDGAAASDISVRICDLQASEAVWRDFEARTEVTPYQRFDWCKALVESGVETGEIAVAIVRRRLVPVALLPVVIERRSGIRWARLLGSNVANTDALVGDPELFATLDERSLVDLLSRASGALGGLDVISFRSFRSTQAGAPNPLARLAKQPSPSQFYVADISAFESPFLERGVPPKLRANLKRGIRRLEEMFGPVRLQTVSDPAALALAHAAFLAQRGERFDAMGVDNIFAAPAMKRLFTLACQQGFSHATPVMVCHALIAGDTIVATSFGARAGTHYSQYINSTSSGPASKYSLMGILVSLMMDELIADGVRGFDMGLGDFPYKTHWTQPETVFDAVVPLTVQGRVAANVTRAATRLKRLIKQDERLWSAAKSMRRALHALRRGPSLTRSTG